jgi:hypothetical protein
MNTIERGPFKLAETVKCDPGPGRTSGSNRRRLLEIISGIERSLRKYFPGIFVPVLAKN